MSKNKKPKKQNDVSERLKNIVDDIDISLGLKNKKTEKVVNKLVEVEKKTGNEWLESEFERVSEENENLKRRLAEALNINNNVQPSLSNETEVLKFKIKTFFRETEDMFLGRNAMNQRFDSISTKDVLGRFLYHFPFIREK